MDKAYELPTECAEELRFLGIPTSEFIVMVGIVGLGSFMQQMAIALPAAFVIGRVCSTITFGKPRGAIRHWCYAKGIDVWSRATLDADLFEQLASAVRSLVHLRGPSQRHVVTGVLNPFYRHILG